MCLASQGLSERASVRTKFVPLDLARPRGGGSEVPEEQVHGWGDRLAPPTNLLVVLTKARSSHSSLEALRPHGSSSPRASPEGLSRSQPRDSLREG